MLLLYFTYSFRHVKSRCDPQHLIAACIRHAEEVEHPVDMSCLCNPGQSSMRLVINLEAAIHLYWSCFENETLAEEFDEMISYEDTCEEEDTVV